jgi:hypothetical protein
MQPRQQTDSATGTLDRNGAGDCDQPYVFGPNRVQTHLELGIGDVAVR